MALDHVSYPVPFNKFDDEVNFLTAAFGHMGLKLLSQPVHGVAGLGADKPWLWIGGFDNRQPIPDDAKVHQTHLALTAKDRAEVDAFHAAALKAGGTCNGPPGIRVEYHPNYYGAFAISPAGHNIEAVIHTPESSN